MYETIAEKGKIFVITDEDADLYQVLFASDAHSTISSTVFLEAMALGIPNIIIGLFGAESVSEIDIQNCILFAKSPEDFVENLKFVMREDIRNNLVSCGKEKAAQFYATSKNPEKNILSILERTY
jgi:predicted glycosyltransferase